MMPCTFPICSMPIHKFKIVKEYNSYLKKTNKIELGKTKKITYAKRHTACSETSET